MYTRQVIEPRLTARWTADSGGALVPAPLELMRKRSVPGTDAASIPSG